MSRELQMFVDFISLCAKYHPLETPFINKKEMLEQFEEAFKLYFGEPE